MIHQHHKLLGQSGIQMLFLVKLNQASRQWWWVMYLIYINALMRANNICSLPSRPGAHTHTQREADGRGNSEHSPSHPLHHSPHKQVISVWNPCNPGSLSVRAALQGSTQAEGQIDGAALDILGPMLPFLDRDSLALVDRGALALRLEEMRSFCLPKEALRDIGALLTQRDLLG